MRRCSLPPRIIVRTLRSGCGKLDTTGLLANARRETSQVSRFYAQSVSRTANNASKPAIIVRGEALPVPTAHHDEQCRLGSALSG